MLEAGELSIHSYADYGAVCKRVIKAFGKGRLVNDLRPDDFEKLRASMARKWGPVRVGNEINRTRIVFNYASKSVSSLAVGRPVSEKPVAAVARHGF